jgi:hypothetical protein
MSPRSPALTEARLDALLEEATVDCYNEAEQITGLLTLIEENLALPFMTSVLGAVVVVAAVELNDTDRIVAICTRDGQRQPIALLDLPLPEPPPAGAEWIEAYRHWAG